MSEWIVYEGKKMRLLLISLLMAVLAVGALGCTAEAAQIEEPMVEAAAVEEGDVTAELEAAPAEEIMLVEEDPIPFFGNGERTFRATNSIDMTINRIQFMVPGSDDWAEDDALANITVVYGETFEFAPNLPLDDSGNIADTYDMRLVFMDGTEKVLAGFPTANFSGLEFTIDDDIAFFTFFDSHYHQSVSTKPIEQIRIAEEEARIEAERVAEEQRRAEEEARRAAEAARQQRARNNANSNNNNQQRARAANTADPCIDEPLIRP